MNIDGTERTSQFNTDILDKILFNQTQKVEKERQYLLKKTIDWLTKFASHYGIKKAYIFGSVCQPYKFNSQSDIDLAVEQINPNDLFSVISFLSEVTGRNVDVIELSKCHFAERIRQIGIVWTATN